MVNVARPSPDFVPFKKEDVEQSLAARFEQQVASHADRLALKTHSHELTYRSLNQAANRVAHAIIGRNRESAVPVALLLDPGPVMVEAMLGVLKAAKIWVPIDPAYPQFRQAYIVEDAQARLILVNDRTAPLANQLTHDVGQTLNLDRLDCLQDDNLQLTIPSESPACILYTSGSTGEPKGVVHSHRNLLHTVMQYTNTFHLSADDRMSLLPSFSHMAGVNTILRGLMNGAAVLSYDVKTRGLAGLASWLRQEEITVYNSAPTLFRHFVGTLDAADAFPQLRVIILGGEVVSSRDVSLYKDHFGDHTVLLNNLGCTELSSYRQFLVDKETQIEGDIVPVGFTVQDRKVLLLDEAGNEVKTNEVGEIAVKSPYLALGYWRNPGLTQERFLPDPRGREGRIYKTGDLGRMLPNGCLIHLGRKDWQVKIRGYRVEPAEIELVLHEHPEIKAAAVFAAENEFGDKRLVAYVIPQANKAPTPGQLRQFVQDKLPEYMVPSAFMALDNLPLTSNGKVDRQLLPAPTVQHAAVQSDSVAPRDALERQLVHIWQQVFAIEPIGVTDNFFDLGGHSIFALRLLAQIEKETGKKVSVAALFQNPTIGQLAQFLRLDRSGEGSDSLVALRSTGDRPPIFCAPGNLGNVFTDLGDLARYLGPDQPFYGLQDGIHNPARIEDLAAHYLSEIQRVQPKGPYWLGGICSGGVVAFEMAQQLRAGGHEVALLALIEPAPPMGARLSAHINFFLLLLRRLWRRSAHHSRKVLELDTALQRDYLRLRVKLNANSWALRRYRPQPYAGLIHLFLTGTSLKLPGNPQLKWCDLSTQSVHVHEIPGNHDQVTGNNDTPIESAHIAVLAARLSTIIAQIDPPCP